MQSVIDVILCNLFKSKLIIKKNWIDYRLRDLCCLKD